MYRVLLLSIIALAIALCATAPLSAGEREDAEARAALELSLAIGRGKAPAPANHAKRPDYSTAYYAALKSGKPLIIHVGGFDCLEACKACVHSGECLTCDAVAILDSKAPRMILAIPVGDKLLFSREWKAVPTQAEISTALKRAAELCAAGECLPGR